jgi:phosphoribosylformylglycinamidine synthase
MKTGKVDTITRWGVVIFPGSNCDKDALDAVGRVLGQDVRPLWYGDIESEINHLDAIVLPGGFSYGDYLRSGAIARFAPVMEEVVRFAEKDGIIIGICNGFQVLTESGLLPGALLRNEGLRFVCREIYIRVERIDTPFTNNLQIGQVLKIPIAHNEGSYFLPKDQLTELENNRQVVFRYCDNEGRVTPEANPNGSLNNIAGIISKNKKVLGIMPHPERRCDPLLGEPHGSGIFQSVIDFIAGK